MESVPVEARLLVSLTLNMGSGLKLKNPEQVHVPAKKGKNKVKIVTRIKEVIKEVPVYQTRIQKVPEVVSMESFAPKKNSERSLKVIIIILVLCVIALLA